MKTQKFMVAAIMPAAAAVVAAFGFRKDVAGRKMLPAQMPGLHHHAVAFADLIPSLFVIDKSGKPVAVDVGMANYKRGEIVDGLKALTNE